MGICKRDIVAALIGDGNGGGDGRLPIKGLCNWNMWRGLDLLQAMDLVFLNNLAYNGKEKTKERSSTNKLRRLLWDGINEVIADLMLTNGGDACQLGVVKQVAL